MSNTEQNLVEALKKLLADSYVLFLKTQMYHWNVEGPHFAPLHALFEEQYSELFEANDTIAERLRAMGHYAPGSFAEFQKVTDITEATEVVDAKTMIANLAKDNVKLAEDAQAVIEAGQAANDEVSVDLAIERKTVHEKANWMLSAHLK